MLKEARRYSMSAVQDEVRSLVTKGVVGRKTQICSLSQYFGERQWPEVKSVLTDHEFLLRDSVCDLIGKESWLND